MIEAKQTVWDFQRQMIKALGIDLGDARVGVAVSDDLGMLAHPLETISVKSTPVLKRVRRLLNSLASKNVKNARKFVATSSGDASAVRREAKCP